MALGPPRQRFIGICVVVGALAGAACGSGMRVDQAEFDRKQCERQGGCAGAAAGSSGAQGGSAGTAASGGEDASSGGSGGAQGGSAGTAASGGEDASTATGSRGEPPAWHLGVSRDEVDATPTLAHLTLRLESK